MRKRGPDSTSRRNNRPRGARSLFVKFEISTASPLPVGQQVFIAGDREGLGLWKPDGLPLTRVADDLWVGMALCDVSVPLEFKITRGSWDSEEVTAQGHVPPNHRETPGKEAILRHTVVQWKDKILGPVPNISGDYRLHEGIHSEYLRYDRTVVVWLPPSYARDPARRYPVCYLQDGQQIFDPRTSTWNQDWEVDEWCTLLMTAGEMQEIIAVGIYATEDRELEYNPSLAGESYARFLIEELKPWVDRHYRTLPDTSAVAGASLGGTMAFWLAWTRPEVFSAAACLSPVFRLRDDALCLDLVRQSGKTPPLKLFLYSGLGDPVERELAEGVAEMVALLRPRGLETGRRLMVVEDAAGQHHEAAWARHTGEWLRFLFPPKS